jgi:hypothetical protein
MERLPALALVLALSSHARFHQKTDFSRFFGRPQALVEGGGGWAGNALVTTDRHGPPPVPGMSGQAEPGKKHRCQRSPPRKKNSGVGGTDKLDAPSYHAPCPIIAL